MINFTGQFNLKTDVCCGDKSIAHRALILGSLAHGTSVIRNVTPSKDVISTANCLRALGADITFSGTTVTVEPITKLPKKTVTLDCGNSATTARLLAGVVAGLGVKARFVGDESLTKRPMQRVIEPLTAMGAKFVLKRNCLFELRASKLHGATINASVNSAQVKSAVLLAGLFVEETTRYVEQLPTRNHTELMLRSLGANIDVCGNQITVCKSVLRPLDIDIPNDTSSVAFGVALAVAKGVKATFPSVLLNETRLGFYRVLQRSGADISFDNVREVGGERAGDIVVNGTGDTSVLKPIIATAQDVIDCIDEVTLLATLALTVEGEHKFSNVCELQHKECNRIQAIQHIAEQCSQQAIFDGKDLTVISNGKLPKNRYFTSFDDHRIAMCEAILSISVGGGSIDKAPFNISFPQFLFMLGISPKRFGLIGENVSDSKSPRLMAHLASQAGICCSYDTVNLPRDISDDKLLEVISAFDGLNVTMPFKNRVATLLNAQCPTVNTVGRNIEPQSTDGYGIMQSLQSHAIDIHNKSLWIVGAGGAAEACIRELVGRGCKLQILNRTKSHAVRLCDKYGISGEVSNPEGILSFVPPCQFEERLPFPGSVKFVLVADYKGYSNLRTVALECELPVIDGLEMLYHQGAKSFALWTDTPVQCECRDFLEIIDKDTVQ
ncbi:MAG: hypothetical protein J1G02_05560 [Clostridiales bacterium]|nr:hypothetical protein [Clostridiales bacterium]